MNPSFLQSLVQFLKFSLVGVSNTLIFLSIYYAFYWYDPALYLIGNTLGWIVSVANAYFWSSRYVFKGGGRNWRDALKQLGKTYLSYGVTYLLSMGLLYLEVDILAWPGSLCPLLNLLVTIPLNFLLNKFWTFR